MALASAIHQITDAPVFVPRAPEERNGNVAASEGVEVTPYVAKFDLAQSLLEANHMTRPRRWTDVLVSVVLHVVLIGTPVFLSLWFTNTLDIKAYTKTMLVGPPPPPPPPPAPAVARVVSAPHRTILTQGKLLAPSFIPKQVTVIKEAPLDDNALGGVEGGVPGGVPGGQMGGVLGGILGGVATTKPAPPPPGKSKAPVRVGGRILAPRAIYTPAPEYPSLARMTKMQGVVTISAVLDEKGDVVEMKVVSGPVLLYKAALDAVAKWKYQPTYLNGEPISVEMNIIVNFQLSGQQ